MADTTPIGAPAHGAAPDPSPHAPAAGVHPSRPGGEHVDGGAERAHTNSNTAASFEPGNVRNGAAVLAPGNRDTVVPVTQPDEELADAIAAALAKYAVAYSHVTLLDMSTADRSWKVHETGHGDPFAYNIWLGEFRSKAEAHAYAAELRRSAAIQVAARHRLGSVAVETERCAKVAETLTPEIYWVNGRPNAVLFIDEQSRQIAAAIRASSPGARA